MKLESIKKLLCIISIKIQSKIELRQNTFESIENITNSTPFYSNKEEF